MLLLVVRQKNEPIWTPSSEQVTENIKTAVMRHQVFILVSILSTVQGSKSPWFSPNRKLTTSDAMQLTWDTLRHLFTNVWGDHKPSGKRKIFGMSLVCRAGRCYIAFFIPLFTRFFLKRNLAQGQVLKVS